MSTLLREPTLTPEFDRPPSPAAEVALPASFADSARFGAYVLLLGVAYYLGVRVGMGFRFQSSHVPIVWPAGGVLVAALWLTPRRRWWILLLAAGVAHIAVVASTAPVWRVIWQVIWSWGFAIATVEVLRRVVGPTLHFGNRRQVIGYMIVSFAMSVIGSIATPVVPRAILGLEPYGPGASLLRAALSVVTGLLLVAPALLLWGQYGVRRLSELRARRLLEAASIMLSLLAVGLIAFGTGPEIARFPWLLLWIVPPLLWASVRFGPLGATTALFGVAALSIWGTLQQLGPFVLMSEDEIVLSLQLFWIVLCTPMMLLAAVIRERDLVEDALHDQRNQLAHVTRVATVGELSGAVAHDLRQPLTAILANAQAGIQLLKRDQVDLGELREILEDITKQDRQAAAVVARLRSFLNEGESSFGPVAIEGVVRDALTLARSSIAIADVDVRTQIASGLPRVRGDQVQLLQVVLNMIVNGCEAMRAKPTPDRHLRLDVAQRDHRHVEVAVADCGVGLPADGPDRVFEPYFTTKDNGLGLGLAIGRSIATAHGGRLWGENNAQGGATMRLLLPTDRANAGHAADRHR